MRLRYLLSFIFVMIIIFLLIIYYSSFSLNIFSSTSHPTNYNFSLDNSGAIQFYSNMRYPSSNISYRIYNCPLKRGNDMKDAFRILSNETILNFYPVKSDEEIFVTCDSKNKLEGDMFIAGEGGPVKIMQENKFIVIALGQILLIKDSTCPNPNVAIHELLHALGFQHSKNPNNIMYNISDCSQEIGADTIVTINKLYSSA